MDITDTSIWILDVDEPSLTELDYDGESVSETVLAIEAELAGARIHAHDTGAVISTLPARYFVEGEVVVEVDGGSGPTAARGATVAYVDYAEDAIRVVARDGAGDQLWSAHAITRNGGDYKPWVEGLAVDDAGRAYMLAYDPDEFSPGTHTIRAVDAQGSQWSTPEYDWESFGSIVRASTVGALVHYRFRVANGNTLLEARTYAELDGARSASTRFSEASDAASARDIALQGDTLLFLERTDDILSLHDPVASRLSVELPDLTLARILSDGSVLSVSVHDDHRSTVARWCP